MCDQDSIHDMVEYSRQQRAFSRRQFGALALAGSMSAGLARAAAALTVTETEVDIKTPDGVCDAYFVHPSSGRHPGVLMWPDAGGLRPAFRQMGRRLAEAGYSVLVPNQFYRSRKASQAPQRLNMDDPAQREQAMSVMRSLNATTHVTDAKALVPWLDAQGSVHQQRKLGTMGYCMGGPMTMRTAASFPERVGAGASFHGGGLATDTADSPHLLVPKMQASYLIAIAENDDQRDPEAKNKLRAAFEAAKLPAEIEVYAGALHGWCPPDAQIYHQVQAERAWARCLALFAQALA